MGASPPQLFGRGGDRPHRPHGVGAYDLGNDMKYTNNTEQDRKTSVVIASDLA